MELVFTVENSFVVSGGKLLKRVVVDFCDAGNFRGWQPFKFRWCNSCITDEQIYMATSFDNFVECLLQLQFRR
jgi:hypothetical protein